MYHILKTMEKGDLHLHLNGTVPTNIIKKLINEYQVELPADYNINTDLQILKPASNLIDYFKPWQALKRLPIGYQCLEIMINHVFLRLKRDKVKFAELRNSPFNISKVNNISLTESVKWLIEAINKCSIIHNIDVGLILSLTRHENSYQCGLNLLEAIKNNNSKTIIGMDFSGDEGFPISTEISKIYRLAKDNLGLGISIHAGETGDLDSLKWAIYECAADRIGHGLAAAKCYKTMDYIKDNDICIEVCLISNLRTGSIANIKLHPVKTFINYQVPFVLCSDNSSVHNKTLTDEYYLFYKSFKNQKMLQKMYNNQIKYSFIKGENIGNKIFNRQ